MKENKEAGISQNDSKKQRDRNEKENQCKREQKEKLQNLRSFRLAA